MNEKRVKEWIILAEGDLKTAKDELSTPKPFTNAVCFHSQQCVEKYLKAYLTFLGKPFRKTHDLTELIQQCIELDPDFKIFFEMNVDKLSQYAIDIRYPEEFYSSDINEAKESVAIAEKVKNFVIEKLKNMGFSYED
jgi:HEPN domain-containing protein